VTSWVRSQRAAAVDVGEGLLLVARDGSVRAIEGDGAVLAREVLGFLGVPRTLEDVIAHVEASSGAPGEHTRSVVRQLIELLATTGAIGAAATSGAAVARRGGHVVVAISGAVAGSHAPALVGALQRRGWTVEVALTETAQRFVAVDALTALVQRAVHTTMWPAAAHAPVPHVALAAWADLVIVYPASATTIARLAHGDFSDLVAAVALTTRAPVAIVPSMNPEMLAAPAVQRNLDQLRADGFAIVHGVPSVEAADAPAVREAAGGAAPAPGEVAATIDALVAAGALTPRHRPWDDAYRKPLVPWASDRCDDDLARALAHHAPPPARLLDVGCGLGQVARHAAGLGYRVVATDVSEVGLSRAKDDAAGAADIVWVRDDVCTSALAGPFDVIVDRATFHILPATRRAAWAATVARLAAPHATVIVKGHADKLGDVTIAGFQVVEDVAAELPGMPKMEPGELCSTGGVDAVPIASRLVVLRR
jgi:phosphopantothenoylcysteine decarboxylase